MCVNTQKEREIQHCHQYRLLIACINRNWIRLNIRKCPSVSVEEHRHFLLSKHGDCKKWWCSSCISQFTNLKRKSLPTFYITTITSQIVYTSAYLDVVSTPCNGDRSQKVFDSLPCAFERLYFRTQLANQSQTTKQFLLTGKHKHAY